MLDSFDPIEKCGAYLTTVFSVRNQHVFEVSQTFSSHICRERLMCEDHLRVIQLAICTAGCRDGERPTVLTGGCASALALRRCAKQTGALA